MFALGNKWCFLRTQNVTPSIKSTIQSIKSSLIISVVSTACAAATAHRNHFAETY